MSLEISLINGIATERFSIEDWDVPTSTSAFT